MERREIVARAIEFRNPPRLPFFQQQVADLPDDVFACTELDRAKSGWFFGESSLDDWGCGWRVEDAFSMGQVVSHPLQEWAALDRYIPPNPRDPFYCDRLEDNLRNADDRYVMLTSHFNLIERLYMLHGFAPTFEDLYLEPAKVERVLDMILEFKLGLFEQLHRRCGNRVHGLFLTDDWGTQDAPYVANEVFEHFFLERYRTLVAAVHSHGWHVILHSDGRINDLIPHFLDVGVDVLNLLQPRTNGIEEIGRRFAGRVCFLTVPDIQATLPTNDARLIRQEARELVEHWSTPRGGLIVSTCGDGQLLGMHADTPEVMFRAFEELMYFWQPEEGATTAPEEN